MFGCACGIAVNFAGGNPTLALGDGTSWTIVDAALTGSNFYQARLMQKDFLLGGDATAHRAIG
jgi:hypothetical protein